MDQIVPPEHDDDKPRQHFLERFASNVREGLIGVLYMMSKDTRGNAMLGVLAMLIDAAQQLRLASARVVDARLATSPYLVSLFEGADVFTFNEWGFIANNGDVAEIVAIVLVALLAMNVIYVGHSWIIKSFNQIWPVRILRSTASFLVGIAFIPLITIFTQMLTCRNMTASKCAVFRPIIAVLLVFFIPFALANRATAFSSHPNANDPKKMPHSRVVTYHQLVRTIYSLVAGFLAVGGGNPEVSLTNVNIWAVVMTVLSGSLCFAYMWLQPYYNNKFNMIAILLMSFVFWLAATFLFHGLVAGYAVDDVTHVIFFYCGIVLFLPLVQFIARSRRQYLILASRSGAPRQIAKSAFDVELKMRLKLYTAKHSATLWAVPGAEAQIDDTLLREIAATYQEAVSNLPESSMICLFHAQFLLHTMNKPLLARRALLLTETRKPSLDESFLVFKTKKTMEENTEGGDIMNYVLGEKHLALSKMYDRRCCEMLVAFWGALGKEEIQVRVVRDLAGQISILAEQAKISYMKLLKLRPNDPELLETYSGFAGSIGNDPDEAQRLLVRAKDMRTRLTKRNSQHGGQAETVFDETSGVLTVDASGGLENGRILGANQQAGRVLNRHSDFLVSKNISAFLLAPLNQPDMVVNKFLESGDESYFRKTFQTFVRTGTSNAILPCSIRLTPFTTDGINFRIYVSIKDDPESRNAKIALVDPESGNVLGLTGSLLQIYPAFREGAIGVNTLLPNYSDFDESFRTSDGGNIEDGPMEGCQLQIRTVQLHGDTSPNVDVLTFPDQSLDLFLNAEDTAENGGMPSEDDFDDSEDDFDAEPPPRRGSKDYDSDASNDKPTTMSFADEPAETAERPLILDPKHTGRLGTKIKEDKKENIAISSPKQASVHSEATSMGCAGEVSGIRRVMLATQYQLEPELARFRRLYLYTILLAGVFVIGIFAVRNWQLTAGFQKNISDLPKAGARRLLLVEVSSLVHSLVLIGEGYILPAGMTEEVAREKLMDTVVSLHEADKDLFEGRYQSSKDILFYYENPSVTMRTLREGSEVRTAHTLFDASTMVTAKAKLMYYMPLSQINARSPLVFFLVNNVRPIVTIVEEDEEGEHGDGEHGDGGEHDDDNGEQSEEETEEEVLEEVSGERRRLLQNDDDNADAGTLTPTMPPGGDSGDSGEEEELVRLICPQLPSLASWELADGRGWSDPPMEWQCASGRYYELLNPDLASNATCDCGCGVIDPDCGYQLPSCGEQAWFPKYVHFECEGVTQDPEVKFCRLESGRCFDLPFGLQEGRSEWTCIPDVFNELSDDLTSLNDCDCNCGGFDADCARPTFNDIYCSDQLDEAGSPIAIPYGTGFSCALNGRTNVAFCLQEGDEVNSNVIIFGSNTTQEEREVERLVCPQLPALSPFEISMGHRWSDPPEAWLDAGCAAERYYELDNFALKLIAVCDCGCGVIDPDCGYQLPSCSEQAWNPEYVRLECEGVETSMEKQFCRLESARCFDLPLGLQNGRTDWTCIPDVFNELSDDMTSLNDCDCNCGGLDEDCAKSFNDLYCSDQLDETGAPIAIPYGDGFYCSLSSATGVAYCVEDGDTAGHGIMAFGIDIKTARLGGRVIGLQEALDATTLLFSAESDQTIRQINLVSLVLAVVTVLIITGLLGATLAPMVLRMDSNTAAVFHQLVEMPSHVFSVVGERYSKRLIEVHESIAASFDNNKNDMGKDKKKAKLGGTGSDSDDEVEDNTRSSIGKFARNFSISNMRASAKRKKAGKKKAFSLDEELRKTSKRWVILVQMSVTLFVAIIYFTGTVWVSYSLADNLADAPFVTNAAGLRRAVVALTMHRLRIYLTGGKMNGGYYVIGPDVMVSTVYAADLQLALMVGDEKLGINGLMREENIDPAQNVLLFEDGCAVPLKQYMPPDWLEPCSEFDNGIASHGLAGMYQYWLDTTEEIVEQANLLNADHSTSTYRDMEQTNFTLTTWEEYKTLATLEAHYLQPLLKNSVDAYVENTNSIIRKNTQQQMWSLIALIVVVVIYDVIVQRLVQSLDNEMKRTRALLLMIPDDVLQKLPTLRKFLVDQSRRVSQPKARGGCCC